MYKETKFEEVLTNHPTRQPTTNPHQTNEPTNRPVNPLKVGDSTKPSTNVHDILRLLVTILSKNIKIILERKAKCRRHEMTPEKIGFLGESDR
jgi:hypothetical protein